MKPIFLIAALFLATFSCPAQSTIQSPVTVKGPVTLAKGNTVNAPAFVSQTQCQAAATANCQNTGLSISSGNIIVVGVGATGGGLGDSFTISDSNSDTPHCGTEVAESTNNNTGQICFMVAGASITSVTCAQSSTSQNMSCFAAWYTPGSLAGTLDQSTGQDQPSTAAWTSGNTSALTGTNDLVIGLAATDSTGKTSTYSDGGTQRISQTVQQSMVLEDRNTTSTSAVAASGTWSGSVFGVALVLAIK